jgi:hypothetical protein
MRLKESETELDSSIGVIYIVGAGRSGSTILDIILGSSSEIVGVGELSYLIEDGFKMKEKCSCGKEADECDFFSRVRDAYFEITGDRDFDQYEKMRLLIERPIMMPAIMLGLIPTKWLDAYCSRTEALYRAIRQVSNKRIILDSSKRPGRLAALAHCSALNVVPLHLVRDGRGFMWSKFKMQQKIGIDGKNLYSIPRSSLYSSVFWILINIASVISMYYYLLKTKRKRKIFLSYEELCTSLEESLKYMGNKLGLNFDDIIDGFKKRKPFAVQHIIGGNKLKYGGIIEVTYDDEWKRNLTLKHRLVFLFIAWPVLLFYRIARTCLKE